MNLYRIIGVTVAFIAIGWAFNLGTIVHWLGAELAKSIAVIFAWLAWLTSVEMIGPLAPVFELLKAVLILGLFALPIWALFIRDKR